MISSIAALKRGDIFFADLGPVVGSEQGGVRPVLVVQNNVGNKYSPTVIIAPITSQRKKPMSTHLGLKRQDTGLPCDSIALMEQVRTLDRKRFKEYIGEIPNSYVEQMNKALSVSFGLKELYA